MQHTDWKYDQTLADLLGGPFEEDEIRAGSLSSAAPIAPRLLKSAGPARCKRSFVSWLGNCLVESFAAYAQAMYPAFVSPEELMGPLHPPNPDGDGRVHHASAAKSEREAISRPAR